jgi:FtsP/CotA-like multicopper oxidase with cupredoxin domain
MELHAACTALRLLQLHAGAGRGLARLETPLDTINGVVFAGHHGARHVMRLGKVEEWTIPVRQVDGVFTHPFHLHVNHVQLTEAAASHRFGFAIGEYYDVVAMPMAEQRGTFKVRFRPADFTGDANVVIHCHLLEHEDGGMMLLTSIVP